MKRAEVSISALREALDYSPQTGEMTWRERPNHHFKNTSIATSWNKRYAGNPAFTSINDKGYHTGSVMDVRLLAHRVAWAIINGYWPPDEVDHINGNRSDNRIENLRSVTRSGNQRNRAKSCNNKSGTTGVFWCNTHHRWKAQIGSGKGREFLGSFRSLESAVRARKLAEKKNGFHENHDRLAQEEA